MAHKAELELERAQTVKQIDDQFTRAIDCLVQDYDTHMKKIAPQPKKLPLRVNIQLDRKNVRIENVHIKPSDCLVDAQKLVEQHLAQRGDPVLEWGGHFSALVHGPLALEDVPMAGAEEEEKVGGMD